MVKLTWLLAKHLDQGLNAARSVQVHRDLHERGHDSFDELLECGHGAYFDQFLAEVVAELVHHDLGKHFEHDMDQTLSEDLSILNLILFKFALNHAATCLVVGHQLDLLHDVELLTGELGLQVLG